MHGPLLHSISLHFPLLTFCHTTQATPPSFWYIHTHNSNKNRLSCIVTKIFIKKKQGISYQILFQYIVNWAKNFIKKERDANKHSMQI